MEEKRRAYYSIVALNEVETHIMKQRLMYDDYGNILKYGGYCVNIKWNTLRFPKQCIYVILVIHKINGDYVAKILTRFYDERTVFPVRYELHL